MCFYSKSMSVYISHVRALTLCDFTSIQKRLIERALFCN